MLHVRHRTILNRQLKLIAASMAGNGIGVQPHCGLAARLRHNTGVNPCALT